MKKKNKSYLFPTLLIAYGLISMALFTCENIFKIEYGILSFAFNPINKLGLVFSAFWFGIFVNVGTVLAIAKRMS